MVVIVITATFATIAIQGAERIQITSDNRSFFGPQDTRFQELVDFEEKFISYSTAAFLITSRQPFENSPEHQRAHAYVHRETEKLPHLTRVESLVSAPATKGIGDTLVVTTILNKHCGRDSCKVATSALDNRTIANRLLDESHSTSAVIASFKLDIGESQQVHDIMSAINDLRADFATRFPSLELHVTGGVPMMQAFVDAAQSDLQSLMPIAGVVLVAILVIVTGSVLLSVTMLLIGALSCLFSLGTAGWLDLVLNSATSSIPVVILALTLATTMHLFIHIGRGKAIHGSDYLPAATRSALLIHATPILMTAGTTIVGMLSLVNVPSPPVKQLGIWVSVGLAFSVVLTYTTLPAVLSFFRSIPESRFATALQGAFNGYARTIEHGKPSLVPLALFTLAALIGLFKLQIDDDFVRYFDSKSVFRQDTDFATDHLAGPYGVELVLSDNSGGTIFASDYFGYLKRLGDHLRSGDRVVSALSLYDVLAEVKEDIAPASLDLEKESGDFLAQLFLTYDFSLQKGQSTADFVNSSQTASRVSVVLDRSTSAEIRQFVDGLYAWHKLNRPDSIDLIVTGESVPTAYLSATNIKSMAFGILASLIFSASVIGWFYRDIRLIVVAFLSILTPTLIGFGLWGWMFQSIGLATTVIVAITIGVVIDDSIHLIVRAKDGQQNLDLQGREAAAYAIYRVGVAVIATTLVLVGGFSVLVFSGFDLNSAFGICVGLILVSATLFDLIVLPRLLAWVTNSNPR